MPIALPNYSFRSEWSKFIGGQARVCYAESNSTRLTHLIRSTRLHRLARLASICLCQSQTATRRASRDCTTPSPNWIQRRPIGDAALRMRTLLRQIIICAGASYVPNTPLVDLCAKAPTSLWPAGVASFGAARHCAHGAACAHTRPAQLPIRARAHGHFRRHAGAALQPARPVPFESGALRIRRSSESNSKQKLLTVMPDPLA